MTLKHSTGATCLLLESPLMGQKFLEDTALDLDLGSSSWNLINSRVSVCVGRLNRLMNIKTVNFWLLGDSRFINQLLSKQRRKLSQVFNVGC